MKKVFLDTNIFQDVLAGRTGWQASFKLLDLLEKNKIKGYCSVLTIPILWYLQKPKHRARQLIKGITLGCRLVNLTQEMITQVLSKKILGDLEDELQYLSACQARCVYLITRNQADFKNCPGLTIASPEGFLNTAKL